MPPRLPLISNASVRIGSLHANLNSRMAALRKDPTPVARSRTRVEAALDDGAAHYGISTGFGALARERVPEDDLETLQRNLVSSHAVGAATLSATRPKWQTARSTA